MIFILDDFGTRIQVVNGSSVERPVIIKVWDPDGQTVAVLSRETAIKIAQEILQVASLETKGKSHVEESPRDNNVQRSP